MDDIQSYTDKLRKTYRQSLDVVLPLTHHEAVVYCSDDEFETLLEGKHSVMDLQTCIYLLERHIDLQQEIIQGLTHLQELHKFDESPSEYNIIADKLLTAQNKLAMLRSRTVRCLTKQIQQRCGDSSMQLPYWSTDTDKDIIRDPNNSYLSDKDTSQTNNSPNERTIYQNGFEKTCETSSDFDQNDNVFEEDSSRNEKKVLQMHPENAHKNDEQQSAHSSQRLEMDRHLQKEKSQAKAVPNLPEETENLRVMNSNTVGGTRKGGGIDIKVHDTRSENSRARDEPVKIKDDLDMVNSNQDEMKHDFEQGCINTHKGDKGVQLFLNVSNFNSDESDEEVSRVCSRHVLEPVEERVTIEVLQPKSSKDNETTQNEVDQNRYNTSTRILEDSCINAKNTSSFDPATALKDATSDTEEMPSKSSVRTMTWDPSLLVKGILGKVKPVSTEKFENTENEEIHMAGYLEKLPVNQKKATLLKSWRKRYFKILHGKLFYFEDHRAAAPISFIKLGGCQENKRKKRLKTVKWISIWKLVPGLLIMVGSAGCYRKTNLQACSECLHLIKVFEIGSKCLEVTENEDLGGKVLIMRCGSWPELQDWRKALESAAKTKVKRQHFELVQEKKPIIIIDFGSCSIKAGFLEDQVWPQVIIPSVFAVSKDNSQIRYYGYEALNPCVRHTSKLFYPLRPPLRMGKDLLDPNDLTGFLEIIFKELRVDASQYQIVMTTPVNLRDQDKERLVELLFDYFQVAAVYMKSQAILSMYSYSATCGIVVNIGDHIDVVPVEDGYVVEAGVKSLPYGGRQITDHFTRLLSSSGYRYFSDVENYIAEFLKIKTCYVSQDFSTEKEQFSENDCLTVDMSEFDLPSGDKMITVAKERFTAFEGLFKPEMWGKDTPSIPDMVYDAVMACSIDSRKQMCRNIFLSGATTKIPGFADRLQTELGRKFPSSLVIQVHASPDRQFAAFIGAAVLASLESFHDLCISREDWEENGPELLKKWDGV